MWKLIVHGGAAPLEGMDPRSDKPALLSAVVVGSSLLDIGGRATDAVERVVRTLEDSGRFIAGRGACPNELGRWELDACICDGSTRRTGAIAGLEGFYPPISIARSVMDKTSNVLLVGEGAARYAAINGFEAVVDPERFFSPSSNRAGSADETVHGTVGAVALDQFGALAAATSTGGTIGKRSGRIGDSPIAGAGTWADQRVAISCTGQGEFFVRIAAAHSVACRVDLLGESPREAMARTIAQIHDLGGEGGLISVDRTGRGGCVFNTQAMRFAWSTSEGEISAEVLERSREKTFGVAEI
jgi:isoaspartyl peptidase/L-asparaginase-like protein (Ntn-hydrolase superfamily)